MMVKDAMRCFATRRAAGTRALLALLVAVLFACIALPGAALAHDEGLAAGALAGVDGEKATGLIPDRTPARSIHDESQARSSLRALQSDALPASYDSREQGNVTGVRDQGVFGTCWSFATIAAMESSLLAKGELGGSDEADLSERHLAYFTYHSEPDALAGTQGDFTTPKGSSFGEAMSDPYLVSGGNALAASYVLETGQGAAEEAVAPYDELLAHWYASESEAWQQAISEGQDAPDSSWKDEFLSRTSLDSALAYRSDARLCGTRLIAMIDKSDVKRAIRDYGAVGVQVYSPSSSCFNEATSSYFGTAGWDPDHVVTLVGWDDDYSCENFGGATYEDAEGETVHEGPFPSADGAWLAKNSWGTWWGDAGYYWISYEDPVFKQSFSKAYVFDATLDQPYDNAYQYDGSGALFYNRVNSGGSIANVFTTHAGSRDAERIEAVAFSLTGTNIDYAIQLYRDLDDASDPTSGVPLLARPLEGKTSYAGYYTVELPEPIVLAEGCRFSVVVTLSRASGLTVEYDVDASSSRANWASFTNAVSFGQSFERQSADAPWDDLASTSADTGDEPASSARLKVFTSDVDDPPTEAFLDEAEASLPSVGAAYTGAPFEPAPSVSYRGMTLQRNVDFTVAYGSNVEVGEATVTVSGMGRFTGSRRLTFSIVPASLEGATMAPLPALVYSGSPFEPQPVVSWGNRQLVAGSDYTLEYRDNVQAGTASVIARGKGNFTGSTSGTFEIGQAPCSLLMPMSFSKTYGDGPFPLGAQTTAGDGALAYSSSNPAIVAVDSSGRVSVKGAGVATITVSAAATANYRACAPRAVTVKVAKAPSAVKLLKATTVFTGKVIAFPVRNVVVSGSAGAVTVRYYADKACTKAVKASSVRNAGTYYAKATVAADANHKAATSAVARLVVTKKAHTLKASRVKAMQVVSYRKAKSTAIPSAKVFKVTKNVSKGKVTYRKVSGNKKISVSKTGKVTVKKGLKRGVYAVKVKLTSAATANYKQASKTIAFKVKVA